MFLNCRKRRPTVVLSTFGTPLWVQMHHVLKFRYNLGLWSAGTAFTCLTVKVGLESTEFLQTTLAHLEKVLLHRIFQLLLKIWVSAVRKRVRVCIQTDPSWKGELKLDYPIQALKNSCYSSKAAIVRDSANIFGWGVTKQGH